MKSSPRNFRLTEEGLKALKILEAATPNPLRGKIVSKALEAAAKTTTAAKSVSFRLLGPKGIFDIHAAIFEIETINRKNREALLKIRPTDTGQAEKLVQSVQRIDDSTSSFDELRLRLANLARTTEELTDTDQLHLGKLIGWVKNRINRENTPPEHKPIYELELRLLQSLIP